MRAHKAAENLVDTPSENLENWDGTNGTDGTNGANETKEMTENEYDWELEQRFQLSRGVSILSHTQTRFSRLRPRTRPRTRPSHDNTIQPKTTAGWLFASGSSWTLRLTGGSRQDTHGKHQCPKGKAVGDPPQATSDERPSDNGMPRTNVLSGKHVQTDVLSAKTGADRHLHTHMVAELARRSHGVAQ